MKISIIVPCFNEEKTLHKIIEKVLLFNSFEKEIIIIDDHSTDDTNKVILNFICSIIYCDFY